MKQLNQQVIKRLDSIKAVRVLGFAITYFPGSVKPLLGRKAKDMFSDLDQLVAANLSKDKAMLKDAAKVFALEWKVRDRSRTMYGLLVQRVCDNILGLITAVRPRGMDDVHPAEITNSYAFVRENGNTAQCLAKLQMLTDILSNLLKGEKRLHTTSDIVE